MVHVRAVPESAPPPAGPTHADFPSNFQALSRVPNRAQSPAQSGVRGGVHGKSGAAQLARQRHSAADDSQTAAATIVGSQNAGHPGRAPNEDLQHNWQSLFAIVHHQVNQAGHRRVLLPLRLFPALLQSKIQRHQPLLLSRRRVHALRVRLSRL